MLYYRLGRLQSAHDMLSSVFEVSLKAIGPRGVLIGEVLEKYWKVLRALGRVGEAAALVRRAEKLGCDVSYCQ